jgi:chemotaxis protein methyltransferase CheR
MKPDAISDLLWQRVSSYIAQAVGLHFPPERHAELQRNLTAAALQFGFADITRCIEWMLAEPPSDPIVIALLSQLTIGDTYFWRDRNLFNSLQLQILPELIQRNNRKLRIWSAACASGEEPYSLAILLQQVLPDWRRWDLTILATDLNQTSLDKAAEGVYGEWSFRDAPPDFKESFFTRTEHGRFAIKEDIRQLVRFEQFNLAQSSWPAHLTGTNAMDIILCRNALMYFSPERAAGVIENLANSLKPEGWLAVSPSECSHTRFPRFDTVQVEGSILYRKPKVRDERIEIADDPPGDTRYLKRLQALVEHAAVNGTVQLKAIQPAAVQPHQHLIATTEHSHVNAPEERQARALANQGRLQEALIATVKWLATTRLDPTAHYLHAMVHQELGNHDATRKALQRVLYLQPEFILAHFALGNLALAQKRHKDATKHFSNTLQLLRKAPPDEPLPESDGTTAAALIEIVAALLAMQQQREPADVVE